ncbi:phage integrase N-terminal domain-containing protein [Polaromonas hydrogenivorans]|uniref:Phage integrase N-terminal domain-containing protein n=1 Tax=Polaromonas hydrogenivorans TaxID=335476 RepID=A0AAU7LYF6_9BURK
MSNKLDELIQSVNVVVRANCPVRVNGNKAGNRTQEQAGQVMSESCRRLHKLGYYLSDISGLQEKHITALVEDWHAQPLKIKTMQNQLSRIRIFCRWLGRENLVKTGGVKSYFPELAPKVFKVSTVAVKSNSWTGNGLDVVQKIKEAWLHDARHGGMLMLGVAFGLRKKEMLRIKLWMSDKGTSLDIDGSVAKNGRFRSIPIESGEFAEFGLMQRRALDEVKKLCNKYHTLGWPGLTFKQSENRYYHYMRRLGLTKFDEGVTGTGLGPNMPSRCWCCAGWCPPRWAEGPARWPGRSMTRSCWRCKGIWATVAPKFTRPMQEM